MNKRKMTLLTLFLFSVVFGGGRAFAQTGWNTIEASTLIGYQVWSPISASDSLGQISDLVIDQLNGRIVLAILSDAPGFGAERAAVPYGALVRNGSADFRLRIPEDQIDAYLSKYRTALVPGVLPAVIDLDWIDHLYREYDQFPYWTEKGEHPEMAFYKSSALMGAKVDLAEGGAAMIDNLVIDSPSGHITFVILSDVPERTDQSFAVPFSMLSRRGENAFALNITKDKLASAPIFTGSEDEGSRAYAVDVYRYFGVQPYWIE